jgi:8-oxo-dGTP pyrophosphatase MutT (NUDIX family)
MTAAHQGDAPTTPIPAGTIVLLRDGRDGLEMFMVVRHHQIDFASGALVFPGGKIDPADQDPALAARLDGADDDPVRRAIQIGAIREAFEEAGVLLARADGASALVDGDRVAALEPWRRELHTGTARLADLLAREALRLACDQLSWFAHWITPPFSRRRFDTHFFIAAPPSDHVLLHDGHESVDSLWITPAQALADAATGTRTLVFPTLRNIEKLAQFSSVAEALHATRSGPVVTIMPWTEQRDGSTWLCIPADAGYPVCAERMDATRRP